MYSESEGVQKRAKRESEGGKTGGNNKYIKKAETGSGKEEQIL